MCRCFSAFIRCMYTQCGVAEKLHDTYHQHAKFPTTSHLLGFCFHLVRIYIHPPPPHTPNCMCVCLNVQACGSQRRTLHGFSLLLSTQPFFETSKAGCPVSSAPSAGITSIWRYASLLGSIVENQLPISLWIYLYIVYFVPLLCLFCFYLFVICHHYTVLIPIAF